MSSLHTRPFVGRVLYINGRSNNNASRFEFNLMNGTYDGADVAFHFNPRFDQREAIRNACQGGGWGAEEKQGGFPLQPGQDFEIQIVCFPEHYQVRIDDGHMHWANLSILFPSFLSRSIAMDNRGLLSVTACPTKAFKLCKWKATSASQTCVQCKDAHAS